MTTDARNTQEPRDSWGFRGNDEIDEHLVVIRHLGGGERYEVFEAWDRGLFARVAAKVLRPHRVGDDRALAALRREGGIGARLNHPNLVRLLRWSDAGPRPHLIFELVPARSVEDHLEDVGPVRVAETCLLGIRAVAALQYMHAEGVLHLDVKPANLTMGDPPRLLDLSLAREGTNLRLDRSVGTAAYMSPEQCRREALTPATDLFGLGATLYEALTATQPFSEGVHDGEDLAARYPQLVEEPIPLRDLASGIPRELEEVVMSCLQVDPKRRPPSARSCAVALEGVIESLGLDHLLAWPRGMSPLRRDD